jgi:hypothetical protein
MSEEPTAHQPPATEYEPPEVEDMPRQDGLAVTAAGGTGGNILLTSG